MTLLARIQAVEGLPPSAPADVDECSMHSCHEPRVEGTLFGRECGHLNDWYARRIRRLGDGTFMGVTGPHSRATLSPFVARALAHELPAKAVA